MVVQVEIVPAWNYLKINFSMHKQVFRQLQLILYFKKLLSARYAKECFKNLNK